MRLAQPFVGGAFEKIAKDALGGMQRALDARAAQATAAAPAGAAPAAPASEAAAPDGPRA